MQNHEKSDKACMALTPLANALVASQWKFGYHVLGSKSWLTSQLDRCLRLYSNFADHRPSANSELKGIRLYGNSTIENIWTLPMISEVYWAFWARVVHEWVLANASSGSAGPTQEINATICNQFACLLNQDESALEILSTEEFAEELAQKCLCSVEVQVDIQLIKDHISPLFIQALPSSRFMMQTICRAELMSEFLGSTLAGILRANMFANQFDLALPDPSPAAEQLLQDGCVGFDWVGGMCIHARAYY